MFLRSIETKTMLKLCVVMKIVLLLTKKEKVILVLERVVLMNMKMFINYESYFEYDSIY